MSTVLPPDDRFMTKAEVARALRVTARTIERWAKLGTLRPVRLSPQTILWRLSAVRAFVAAAEAAAPGPEGAGAPATPRPAGPATPPPVRTPDGTYPPWHCRHCGRQPGKLRPRGLCWVCYDKPGVRELYPSTSKFARRGVEDRAGDAPPPDTPTSAPQGTPEKMLTLMERARRGQVLFDHRDGPGLD